MHLATASGTQLASFQSTRVLKGVIFDLSSLTRGTSYRIYTGGSVSGTAADGGLYTGGTLSGTQVGTVTARQRPRLTRGSAVTPLPPGSRPPTVERPGTCGAVCVG
nr:hypothetical protein GCM10020092_007540 [Actinoplanes digitatis]